MAAPTTTSTTTMKMTTEEIVDNDWPARHLSGN